MPRCAAGSSPTLAPSKTRIAGQQHQHGARAWLSTGAASRLLHGQRRQLDYWVFGLSHCRWMQPSCPALAAIGRRRSRAVCSGHLPKLVRAIPTAQHGQRSPPSRSPPRPMIWPDEARLTSLDGPRHGLLNTAQSTRLIQALVHTVQNELQRAVYTRKCGHQTVSRAAPSAHHGTAPASQCR